jgi:hypothetical protein
LGDTRYIAARPVQAGNKSKLHRIARCREDNRNRSGRRLCRDRRRAIRDDRGHLAANQIGRHCGQSIVLTLGPAVFDEHVLAFSVAGFAQALAEGGGHIHIFPGRSPIEEPDHGHRRLLRVRRQRPRRCAAEKRDELAPFLLIELHLVPCQQGPDCRISNWRGSVRR